MTSSDTLEDMTPSAAPTPRRLRRVHDGRVGAGVATGLGQYFGLDPVLFRVLFATSAFFGGAGIIAYLLAWAAIPDEGTHRATVDRWVDELRRRRAPLWMVVGGLGLFIWLIAFSWWAPGRFLPAVGAVVLVLFLLARRDQRRGPWTPPPPPAAPPVDLRKHTEPNHEVPPPGPVPPWLAQGRAWFEESRTEARARRRRAQPVRIATLIALFVAFGALALTDALTGIPMQIYFWSGLAIAVVGLLTGLVLRRAPIALALLAVPFALGTIAFTGSSASFSDGTGERHWTPTAAHDYRLAFGQGVLDLRKLDTTSARHLDVTIGAGRALIIVPRKADVTVLADVRFGAIDVDGNALQEDRGVSDQRTVEPPADATGQPVTVDIHVSAGNVSVDRR